MPKRRAKARPKAKKPKKGLPNTLLRRRSALWTVISGAATILTFWILWPRVDVTHGSPLDTANVFSAPFVISNTGNIPLDHAGVRIIASYLNIPTAQNPIKFVIPGDQGTGKQGIAMANPSWQDHEIEIDNSITISPENQVIGKVSEADIVVQVTFHPWFLPINMERRFRFVAIKDGSGNVYWRSWPLSEKAPAN